MANTDITEREDLSPASDRANVIVPVLDLNETQDPANLGARQKKVALSELMDRTNHQGTQPASTISDLTEAVQDIVGAFLGTNGGITYDDANNAIVISLGNNTDPEAIRDTIGAALIGVGPVAVTVNDAADTITIGLTYTPVNSTDVANDLTETQSGKVLDARQGKVLKDLIDGLQSAYNDLSVKVQMSVFTSVIKGDKDYDLTTEHSVTEAINFTKDPVAMKAGSRTVMFLRTTGQVKPTFSSDFVAEFDSWVNTAGTLNRVTFIVRTDGKFSVDIRNQ